MKTTIEIPEALYKKAKIRAIERGQTLKDVVINSLMKELEPNPTPPAPDLSFMERRKLLPEYAAALQKGAFSGGTDSTQILSEDSTARENALL